MARKTESPQETARKLLAEEDRKRRIAQGRQKRREAIASKRGRISFEETQRKKKEQRQAELLTPTPTPEIPTGVPKGIFDEEKPLTEKGFLEENIKRQTPELFETQLKIQQEGLTKEAEAKKLSVEQLIEAQEKAKVTKSEEALIETEKRKKEARAFLERQKTAIQTGFARGPEDVIFDRTALARTATERAESRTGQIISSIESSEFALRSGLANIEKARLAGDFTALAKATNEIATLRGTIASEKKTLREEQDRLSDDILAELTGTETDEDLQTIADQFGVDTNFLRLKRDKLEFDQLFENQKTVRALQKQTSNFIKGLSDSQMASLGVNQAIDLNTKAGLPDGTVQNFVLKAQEIEKNEAKLSKEEQDIERQKLRAEIDKIEAQAEKVRAETEELKPGDGLTIESTNTALKSGDMKKSVGDFKVIPSIEGSNTSKIGTGNIILGSKWIPGLDIDGTDGQEFDVPDAIDGGEILKIDKSNAGFGNSVTVRDKNGLEWSFSHLNSNGLKDLKVGQILRSGDIFSQIGKSGTVEKGPKGDGSHLDITIRKNGATIPANEVEALINSGGRVSIESTTFDSALFPIYREFIEKGKKPTEKEVQQLGGLKQFGKDARQGYIEIKRREFKDKGFEIEDPDLLMNLTGKQKETLDEKVFQYTDFVKNLDSIINDIKNKGVPSQSIFGRGATLKKNITDLRLKAKELRNLGVLNGPDLSLMEEVIPDATGIFKALTSEDAIKQLSDTKNKFITEANTAMRGRGIVPTGALQIEDTLPNLTNITEITNMKSSIAKEIEGGATKEEITEFLRSQGINPNQFIKQ